MSVFNSDISISYYLDKSRKDKNGKHKIRLQVYDLENRSRKYFSTRFSFSPEEFESITKSKRPREAQKEIKASLNALEARANNAASQIEPFNFEDFERLLFNKQAVNKNLNFYYSRTVDKFNTKGSISTANNYKTALKCLLRFHGKPVLNFAEVSIAWLEGFQKFCIEEEQKSLTTVSIYLRTLRTIFNDAIAENTISPEQYPFGRRKYQIPSPKGVKKALSPAQLKVLFKGEPETPEQQKAKDFWFLSYLCNGMNFKDILNLRFKDIKGEKFSFARAKTKSTNSSQKAITVHLNDFTKAVIDKYKSPDESPESYLFEVLKHGQSPLEQYRLIKNFIRSINQNFLKYAKNNGIEEKVSSYWARHSFATMAIRKGASIEFVGEAVGHTNIKTTMGYFAGFEDETKKAISDKLLDF
jgi:integrase/recombinase XerD